MEGPGLQVGWGEGRVSPSAPSPPPQKQWASKRGDFSPHQLAPSRVWLQPGPLTLASCLTSGGVARGLAKQGPASSPSLYTGPLPPALLSARPWQVPHSEGRFLYSQAPRRLEVAWRPWPHGSSAVIPVLSLGRNVHNDILMSEVDHRGLSEAQVWARALGLERGEQEEKWALLPAPFCPPHRSARKPARPHAQGCDPQFREVRSAWATAGLTQDVLASQGAWTVANRYLGQDDFVLGGAVPVCAVTPLLTGSQWHPLSPSPPMPPP